MYISLAESIFILLISCLAAGLSYAAWTYLLPRLPLKVPPVLLCIVVGCAIRLLCKPLLESESADAFMDREAVTAHKQHVYGQGVVRTISHPFIATCLACVGILIGSHIDLPFLRRHTRSLVSMTVGAAAGAYLVTLVVGLLCFATRTTAGTAMALLPFVHLIAATAMERSSSEALATISDLGSLRSTSADVVFFSKSTVFLAAAMDVSSVVVFVLSLAVIRSPGSAVWHMLEIFLGTLLVAAAALAVGRAHVALQHQTQRLAAAAGSLLPAWSIFFLSSPQYFYQRSAALVLSTIVLGSYIIPGAELLLAAVVVGMRLESEKKESSGGGADSTSGGEKNSPTVSGGSGNSANNGGSAADIAAAGGGGSIITTIDSQSILVYSILFSVIGLRLDAAQLIMTLIASPKVSLLLYAGRIVGLVVGASAGAIAGGTRLFARWRGVALVTRIAVSIILLQKMEDALPQAKAMVHAAIGAVLLDMVCGPSLLQWALRSVEAEAAGVPAAASAASSSGVAQHEDKEAAPAIVSSA